MDIFWKEAKKLTMRENDYTYLKLPSQKNNMYAIYFVEHYGQLHSQLSYTWDATSRTIIAEKRDFKEKEWGERMYNYNFELHIGSIYGLPTKILACFTSLIGASLPITGFLIWWNRKKKAKKSAKAIAGL